MYRFLLTPRWVVGLLVAVAAAWVCVTLAGWQWDRREHARTVNAPVLENYDDAPRPVDEVLPDAVVGGALLPEAEWTPVTATGRYLVDETVLVRNRIVEGQAGYEVLVPLRLTDGRTLLVDRGWLPVGSTGQGPDDVPPPPTGQTEVVVRLAAPEPASDRVAPERQVLAVHPETVAAMTDVEGLITSTYGILDREQPAPPRAPRPLPRPVVEEGPHLSYSLQWYVFAAGALVGYGVLARRHAQDLRRSAGHEQNRPASATSGTGRRGRRRPTAEEQEDALLDAAERRAEHRGG